MPWIETVNGLWYMPDDLCEQLRQQWARDRLNWIYWNGTATLCGLPVVWQEDRQETVDYSVNRAERRRRRKQTHKPQ